MSYLVNGRNLAVNRLIVRGKDADKRMKYMHVSPKGTTVITPHTIARVSLPGGHALPTVLPVVIPQTDLAALPMRGLEELTALPQGEPAVTGPNYLVPQIEKCFPGPEHVTATFTCNGDLLRKLLTVACEVSKDSDKTMRLRICGDYNTLRIDNYRQPGDQEFCGILKGIDYDGSYIPGEKSTDAAKVEKKPQQKGMMLKVSSGRKFRGVGE